MSGGNQQKALLGRWFALAPRVLVLAEPTRGVDVGAKREIYGLIQEIADAGSCVVMISSELPELLGIADTIHVMYRGEIMASFDADEADEEQITQIAVGGSLERR